MNFKNFAFSFVAITALLSSLGAHATETKTLMSSQGTRMSVQWDYAQINSGSNKPRTDFIGYGFRFELTQKDLTAQSKVRAVIVNKVTRTGSCSTPNGVYEEVYILDLKYDQNTQKFVGSFEEAMEKVGDEMRSVRPGHLEKASITKSTIGYCFNSESQLEMALVVDGVWQQDPVSVSSNFKLW